MSHDRPLPEVKIATLASVREHTEGDVVELWWGSQGRIVVRAWNECHNNYTDVDLFDLLAWIECNQIKSKLNGRGAFPSLPITDRDQ